MEEDWSPSLPSFAGHFRRNVPWNATVAGTFCSFTNWGLFGDHHRFHHYRGWVTSRCQWPNGIMRLNPPTSPSG